MSRNNSQPFHRKCFINRLLNAMSIDKELPDLKKTTEEWEDKFFKEFEAELRKNKNNLLTDAISS